MLIGRYYALAKSPGRSRSGFLGASPFEVTSSSRHARFISSTWSPKSGQPDGYRPPYSTLLPRTAGALTARNNLSGAGDASIAMAGGVNGDASLTGAGDLAGVGQLIVSMVAALTGSGTITSATAQAFLNLAASLAGAGDLTGAATALGHAAAALSGAGALTTTARATGELAASIVVTGTALNTANVAAAVWNALATNYNTAGTMGEKLNDAGSAGNPWATIIEAGLTAEEILRILAAAVAGVLVVAPDGSSVVFTGLDGVTPRISGDTDADGNRSNVVLDGT